MSVRALPTPLIRDGARSGPDPRILACVVMTAIFGLAVGYQIAPYAWGVDIERTLRAGVAIVDGTYGSERGYLYSPLAALVTVPLTWLPVGVAVVGTMLAKLALLVAGSVHEGRGLRPVDLGLVAVGAVLFIPSVHDLLLGNVSIPLAAAVALVVWKRDATWAGIALGLVLATIPKPQLLPFLLWAAVFRPRAFVGAVVVAAVATLFGLLVLGVDPYRTWVALLRAPEYLDGRPTQGNLALSAWDPVLAIALSGAAIIATIAALRRGPWPGLVACLCLGLLVAPYTMAYSAVILLLAARPLAIVAPRATILLALAAPVAIIVAFPVWVGATLALALVVHPDLWRAVPSPGLSPARLAPPHAP